MDGTSTSYDPRGLGEPAEHDAAPGPGRLRRGAGVVLRGAAEAVMWGGF
jgi:hypothetical protein